MARGEITVVVPSPHRGDIGGDLRARLLRRAQVDTGDWEAL
jgi:hypothetical protein